MAQVVRLAAKTTAMTEPAADQISGMVTRMKVSVAGSDRASDQPDRMWKWPALRKSPRIDVKFVTE